MLKALNAKIWHRLGLLLSVPALTLGLFVSLISVSSVQAVGSYDNAAIADKALQYNGQWGGNACNDASMSPVNGQCRMFVNCIVKMVSGGTQMVNTTNGGYFGAFLNAGGVEVTDFGALKKGDIVQKYVSESDLHTWIIVSRDADGKYWVVDSNSQYNEMVRHYKRTWFTGLDSTTRAFRMGTVGASTVPSGTGSPARSDTDNNGGADLFIMTPTATGAAGHSLLSTYQGFWAQYWWNGTGFGWGGVTPLVGDVNGDKKADHVFLTNEGANGTKAFVSLSTGTTFSAPQLWWNGAGWGYSGIKASLGDVDNNGGEDLVITTSESVGSKAFVLRSTYQGFLAPQYAWDGSSFGWSGITPLVGDVDGDKKADYVFISNEGANGTKAFVAKSIGNTFGTTQQWWNGTGWGYTGIKPTLGDVDGNGGADLVITTNEAVGSAAFALRSTYQGFLNPEYWWNGSSFGWSGITPFTGDVNGDKKADYVILTNEGANGTKAFTSLSNGSTFGAPQLWWNGQGWGYAGIKAYLK